MVVDGVMVVGRLVAEQQQLVVLVVLEGGGMAVEEDRPTVVLVLKDRWVQAVAVDLHLYIATQCTTNSKL